MDFAWAYPDVPPGVGDGVDLIRASSRFAAEALRRSGVSAEIVVVPPAVSREDFERPFWEPGHPASIDCRHLVWGGPGEPLVEAASVPVAREKRLVSRVYRRVYPRLSPETIEKVAKAKAIAAYLAARPSPKRVALALARRVYWRYIRRWLNQDAIAEIGRAKRMARERAAAQEPPPPLSLLWLGGLVYAAAVDPLDPAHNHGDLLTAFLLAFRDREDVSLVVELVGDPSRRSAALATIRDDYLRLQIHNHRCRLVVIAEDLDPQRSEIVKRATTYFVSASRAEAGSLPCYRAMAGGRPVIAPDHSGLGDLMDREAGFVLGSTVEPAPWPGESGGPLTTTWNRLNWSDLLDAFGKSAAVVGSDGPRYRGMAEAARRRIVEVRGEAIVLERLSSEASH